MVVLLIREIEIMIKSLIVIFLGLFAVGLAQQVKYDNYKVYRLTPQNEAERTLLLNLEKDNPGVVFWKHVRHVGQPVDIMVPPHLQSDIVAGFNGKLLKSYEMIDDVQSLINAEAAASINASPKLSWDAYYTVSEIYQFLDEITANNSAIATTGSFGKSFLGNDMRYIRLSRGTTKKPIILVDANIHAREWITNAIATYLINSLVNGEDSGLLDRFDFVIIPVMNPDGYEYSRTTDRMWRKTRSDYATSLCRGADPNRNFGFGWNTGGSSNQACSDTFMGVAAFSEAETAAADVFFRSLSSDTVFYLSLHSYSQLILIPYGTDLGRVPDHDQHMRIGNLAGAAIARRYGTQFEAGNIVELLYVASGASVDYMKGEFDTDLAYTFEMRDTGRYGFILPADQIVPSALEFLDGLRVILDELSKKEQA